METSMLGLVAGSHNSNEFIIIRQDGDFVREMEGAWCSGEMCEVCGDEIGTGNAEEGAELFVACNECAFPVCRDCYDYERREGNQVCPQCNTRYKRLQGCARVEGDEEEDGIDDLENEFDFDFDGSIKHDDHMEMTMSPQEEEEKAQESHNYDNGNHALVPSNMMSKEMMRRQARAMDPSKDLAAYGYGSVAWKERTDIWRQRQTKLLSNHNNEQDPAADDNNTQFPLMDEGRQPLSRKLGIPSSEINPYRMIIIIRVVVLGFFFHYRVMNPVQNAYVLWVVSVICEIWFTLSWILNQLPKLLPVKRETYLDRLSLRYEREGECSEVCPIDILVNTVDPLKEPPLVTANTILSILALDYPPHKLCCYVSDDAAAILTFEALSQTCEFAKKWVPFCNKFNIEPRAPEWYFAEKLNYLKHKIHPSFVKERRAMKREYEEFRVRINFLVAKANKVPEEGWIMQDGTPWPGNSVRDHPGMIQVFLGKSGGYDMDGNELPRLVYVSREKRPTFNHHRKAGALNSLVRVSAVLSNAPFLLNLDHDSYINNSKVIREAMCFMMDPLLGKRVCFVQFSQRSDGADATNHHQYEYQTSAFFDINMKGLDGIQGPTCVGTRCVYRRQALYGFDAPRKNKSPTRTCNCWPKCGCGWCCMEKRKKKNKTKKPKIEIMDSSHRKVHSEASIAHSAMMNTEDGTARVEDETVAPITDQKLAKKFGQSPIFIASTQLVDGERVKHGSLASLLSEAIHVISCGYEEKTEWGKEVGWIYGSITEDTLTGFKMHCHGWRSIYCIPERPAFKVHAPKDLSNNLQQVFQRALGSIEIFTSKHCPIWYGYDGGLKWLERVSYINAMLYPFTSIPLVAYCALPSVCLLSGNFIIPEVNTEAGIWFLSLFICIFATSVLEMRWSRVRVDEWWRNEQFWVIGSVSAHLFAVFVGIFKVLAGVNTSFEVKAAASNKKEDHSDLLALKWTTFLIIPTTLLMLNMIAMVAGVSHAINNGLESWGPLFGKLLFSLWVILHLYPFLKGMMGRHNRTPTIVLVWSILLASFFSVLWVKIDPFSPISDAPILEECGLDCN